MTVPKKKHLDYYAMKKYDGMMGRCYRESDISYPNYGGRGIRVDAEWIRDINSFRKWFREELIRINVTPEEFLQNPKKYQLDRIDSNGHYVPANCRLVSPQANQRNKNNVKTKVFIAADGSLVAV